MGSSNGNDHAIISNTVNWFAVRLISFLILASFADAEHVKCGEDNGNDVILSTPQKCSRECKAGAKPLTCYYKFTLETYVTMGEACNYCTPNITNQFNATCQCVTADGVERNVLTANRMIPGPSIQVCLGDYVVIDLVNQMNGIATTIHWHGIFQNGSQYYDGVPFITQCPVADGNSFRYQWIAGNEGTHFWHAHHATQRLDGLTGTLVVRDPNSPNRHLYDCDKPEHVILLSEWFHTSAYAHWPGTQVKNVGHNPDALLIGGFGQYTDPTTGNTTTTPLAVYEVSPGKKCRFRYITATGTHCIMELTIENHTMGVIATDGVDIVPIWVNTILSTPGERFDFILNPKKAFSSKSFWIRVRAVGVACGNTTVQQFAILRYKESTSDPDTPKPAYNESFTTTPVVANALDGNCSSGNKSQICISNMRTAISYGHDIRGTPHMQLKIGFSFTMWTVSQLFEPDFYRRFMNVGPNLPFAATLINISHVAPPSPPSSQPEDNPPGTFCNKSNLPPPNGGVETCTHIVHVPLNSIVEIIGYDAAGLNHPMHLHGYHFFVLGMDTYTGNGSLSDDVINMMDRENKITRNFHNPPLKDTISIPANGYVVTRFRAMNPGYWLLHCHIEYHMLDGMEMIIHVGEQEDLPPVPKGFPKCGNFNPPIKRVDQMKHW